MSIARDISAYSIDNITEKQKQKVINNVKKLKEYFKVRDVPFNN